MNDHEFSDCAGCEAKGDRAQNRSWVEEIDYGSSQQEKKTLGKKPKLSRAQLRGKAGRLEGIQAPTRSPPVGGSRGTNGEGQAL